MPDCDNTIVISGPEVPLTMIKNLAIKYDLNCTLSTPDYYIFDLESLYPNPFNKVSSDCTANQNALGNLDPRAQWYLENWGTTRVKYFEEMEDSPAKYVLGFLSTAPPLKAFHKISADYPELTFTIDFWGSGSGYCGTYAYQKGECIFKELFENDEYDALFAEQSVCNLDDEMTGDNETMWAEDESGDDTDFYSIFENRNDDTGPSVNGRFCNRHECCR